MFPTDIPGYVQGFRFSDDEAYYDAATQRFRDLAGYGHLGNDLEIHIGTPAFVTINGQRGLTLDNTVQGRFLPAIPWDGTCILVAKPTMGTNGNIYPVLVGYSGTLANNGAIRLRRITAGDYRHNLIGGGTQCTAEKAYANDGLKVTALALSQETRKGYGTADGVTVSETSAVADTGAGNFLAFGSTGNAGVPSDVRGIRARFGNLSGTIDDTSATANTCTICEMHFFKGNAIVDAADEVQAALARFAALYGVT